MNRSPAFIFDMDGVIVDSTNTHTEAWREYLRRHSVEQPYIAERMLGRHNNAIVAEFFGAHLTPDEVIRHGAEKEALYRELMTPQLGTRLVPGVLDFISRFPGVPKAIASNAEPENVRFVVEHAGLARQFSVMLSGADVSRPKPAPDVFLRAAELLGVAPADCIVFEDSPAGVEAARRAGMRVVGILTTVPNFGNVDLAVRDFTEPVLHEWLSANSSPVR
ncbi:MAG TPA: HAD family phosphatase [Bryobacteraceae bacterium]|nr:HAD family phosphatase [Bryobacteraceae bacterium]